MSPKNKHLIVLVLLIVLTLIAAHNSSLEQTVTAQNMANFQFQDIAFNAETVLSEKESDDCNNQNPHTLACIPKP